MVTTPHPSVLVRADAGPGIGNGHVMRCLAAAEAVERAEGRAEFAISRAGAETLRALRDAGVSVHEIDAEPGTTADSEATARLAVSTAADWVLSDGYALDEIWRGPVRETGVGMAVIDDGLGASVAGADVVVDHNPYASPADVEGADVAADVLVGSRYTLIRDKVRTAVSVPAGGGGLRILVSMGAADPAGLTTPLVEGIAARSDGTHRVTAVIGPDVVDPAGLLERLGRLPGVEVIGSAADMGRLLGAADLAIVGAGVTVWEAMSLGVPPLVVAVADNQRRVAEYVGSTGAGVDLGTADAAVEALDEVLVSLQSAPVGLEVMREACRRVIDGAGADRLARRLSGPRSFHLRPASPDDEDLLWRWATDPDTRAASFTGGPADRAEHGRWFSERLADPATDIHICVVEGERECGVVRFAHGGGTAVISVTVAPALRGSGLGSFLVWRGCEQAFADAVALDEVRALVKPDNRRSLAAFESAGFRVVQAAGAAADRVTLEKRRPWA